MSFLLPRAEAQTQQLENPFLIPSIQGLLIEIINVLLIFAVPIVVFFTIYSGFRYVMARGNPDQIKSASRSLMYSLIGVVIIFGAWAITSIVESTVNAF